ncbi:MAG: endonuclease III [Candidatus Paceibacterota bacterium]|jgi:endonuclease-3
MTIPENVLMLRRARAHEIVRVLKKLFPIARVALNFSTPWELAVAVILSAQTTDKKVNEITPALFKKYPNVEVMARVPQKDFEPAIKTIGLYHAKAKNILATARIIVQKYNGAVPHTMEELVALPGIGRKTANIILSNAFGITEGIAVDTHVRRLAIKLGLTDSANPTVIERDLMAIFPKKEWADLNHRLVMYGRTICPARKHDCRNHPLTKIYPRAADIWFSPSARLSSGERTVG